LLTRLCLISIVLVAHAYGESVGVGLEGCPDSAKLARALRELQKQQWTDISIDTVTKFWPSDLRGVKCGPDCFRLYSEDRIIRGQLECGASLRFDTTGHTEEEWKGRLESITIKHATYTREARDAAERILAGAIRMETPVTDGTGFATHEGEFQVKSWTEPEPERRVCSRDVRGHARIHSRWQFIFEFSCWPSAQ
jgi:hypothetical protein